MSLEILLARDDAWELMAGLSCRLEVLSEETCASSGNVELATVFTYIGMVVWQE